MNTAVKKQRIEVRCTEDQRSLIDRALDLTGRSLTDFVLSAVQDAAVQTIKDYEIVSLNKRDSLELAARLIRPAMPNERLRAAKKKRDRAGTAIIPGTDEDEVQIAAS